MFTDREIIFEPLNENLKGFYNYKSKPFPAFSAISSSKIHQFFTHFFSKTYHALVGNFEENTKMGFIISYIDITGRPTKIPSPDPDSNSQTLALATSNMDVELVYHV
jgi:hypothetical protein